MFVVLVSFPKIASILLDFRLSDKYPSLVFLVIPKISAPSRFYPDPLSIGNSGGGFGIAA
jgi:hypothetical protein